MRDRYVNRQRAQKVAHSKRSKSRLHSGSKSSQSLRVCEFETVETPLMPKYDPYFTTRLR